MTEDFPRRGDVYWTCLDPTLGSEVNKTRPALILSNDIANKRSQRVIVAPITSSIDKVYPFEAKIKLPEGFKKVMLDQIRSIDKMRLKKRIASIPSREMNEIERALKLALALS